ncbi:MAG: hypothetical protein QM800_05880 [Paludibacter sp.]
MEQNAWQPKLYTDQAAAPVIAINGSTITWADNNYVLCWAVFKDGVFVKFVTTNSYTVPVSTSSIYTVRAANEMGGLSAASNGVNGGANGLEELKSNVFATLNGKNLILNNVEPGATVSVYSFTGLLLQKQIATSNTVTLPVASSCIVKVNSASGSVSLKVIK